MPVHQTQRGKHLIAPYLWFDKEAKEAAEFYVSLFPQSKIDHVSTIHGVPSPTGDCDIVSFNLSGQPFMAISAGPLFKFNPSVSFLITCQTPGEAEMLWTKLSKDGSVLMEFGKYDWAERYGWLNDKFGVSWQVMVHNESRTQQKIIPVLMFVGPVCGKAEEAINFYTSIFPKSQIGHIARYDKNASPNKEGTITFASFTLEGKEFGAMDSGQNHDFSFSEAISFLIPCEDQEDIDYYWEKLSADPSAGQCGWLKDKYGLSWQVWPTQMGEMMEKGTPEQIARVTQAFMPMKKFDLAVLKKAYEGK